MKNNEVYDYGQHDLTQYTREELYDEIIYSLLDLDGGTQKRLVRYTLDYVISLLENPLKPTIY